MMYQILKICDIFSIFFCTYEYVHYYIEYIVYFSLTSDFLYKCFSF
jgi:hypothetical protein